MANGRVFQQIDIQAKGELGALVASLNTTLQNLQQLDTSVKHQTTQVPELAAQLDAITADTERATQTVMNRLDTLMAASDAANAAVKKAVRALGDLQEAPGRLPRPAWTSSWPGPAKGPIPRSWPRRSWSTVRPAVGPPPPPADLDACLAPLATISDEAFEILNTLQFQDITRQKVEKVVLLLKQFKEGLNRLLDIFHIDGPGAAAPADQEEIFGKRATATQEHIFETTLEADEQEGIGGRHHRPVQEAPTP